ncbi:hypothetical protein Pmani_019659 [Petrolisthes manimaculis]|uniref:Uncharacterized protein n=1 Tax=Petrolisthes manimaculis TaxID=1843537 RepID=A0AAE1U5D1_9EUCA|nr:hypothetical protein Pmani_019659 [Petrolisthes manimaculis]
MDDICGKEMGRKGSVTELPRTSKFVPRENKSIGFKSRINVIRRSATVKKDCRNDVESSVDVSVGRCGRWKGKTEREEVRVRIDTVSVRESEGKVDSEWDGVEGKRSGDKIRKGKGGEVR